MRRFLAAAVLLLLASLAGARPARAQLGGLSLGAAAGPVTPGHIGSAFDTGIHVQALASLSLPLLPIGFRGEAAYDQMDPKTGSHALKVASGVVNATFSLPFPLVHPYAIGGAGYYLHNSTFASREGKVGFNAGVGAELKLPVIRAFAEVRYHNVNYPNHNRLTLIPITVGVVF